MTNLEKNGSYVSEGLDGVVGTSVVSKIFSDFLVI